MIFYSFNQLNNVLIFIFLGIVVSIIKTIINLLFLLNFSKKIKNIAINCIFYMFFTCFFVILLNIFNFGFLNITLFLSYLIGYIWFKSVTKNLVAFYQKKWYTNINKNKKETNARKF